MKVVILVFTKAKLIFRLSIITVLQFTVLEGKYDLMSFS